MCEYMFFKKIKMNLVFHLQHIMKISPGLSIETNFILFIALGISYVDMSWYFWPVDMSYPSGQWWFIMMLLLAYLAAPVKMEVKPTCFFLHMRGIGYIITHRVWFLKWIWVRIQTCRAVHTPPFVHIPACACDPSLVIGSWSGCYLM